MVRWLFVLGLSLDIAGAVLVAFAVLGRTPGENRQEALSYYGANFWVVLIREREQARVRAGIFLIGGGFLLQLAGHLAGFAAVWLFVAIACVGALGASAFLGGRWLADRAVPLRYYEDDELDLPDGVTDQRHAFRLRTKDEVETYERLYAEKMVGREIIQSEESVKAQISGGQWMAPCPRDESTYFGVWPDRDRAVCSTCCISYRIEFPHGREQIERLLAMRPSEPDRRWEPGQTVEAVRAENEANGL
ncbi:MAG TPA: hypothetical protein VN960_05580 [Gaiellaceae bacterium]|nr:hypothetical protein [Gaiellaceae bacterium]